MINYYQDIMISKQVKKDEVKLTIDKGVYKNKDKCKIYIPLKFIAMMNLIHKNLENKNDEFSVFFKVEVDEEDPMVYYIIEDYDNYKKSYIIPEQLVNQAHFDNLENVNFSKYTGCIHRHPQGVNRFSLEDEEKLNDNVEVSVLFIPASKTNKNIFPYAIVNLPLANGKKVQFEAECIIDDDIFYEEEREIIYSKLKKYINEEYITNDIEITVPEDYCDEVIVDIPLDNNNTMTLKVDYDLFTKEEREDIINDVKKYIKHDTNFDRPKVNFAAQPRQFAKTNRLNNFINDLKQNTKELNEERELSYLDFDLGDSEFDSSFYSVGDYSYYKNDKIVNI